MKVFLASPLKKKQYLLLLGDVLIILGVVFISYSIKLVLFQGGSIGLIWDRLSWLWLYSLLVFILTFYILDLYNLQPKRTPSQLFLLTSLAILAATGMIAIGSYLFPQAKIGRVQLGIEVPLLIFLIFFWRIVFSGLFLLRGRGKKLAYIDFESTSLNFRKFLEQEALGQYWFNSVIQFPDYGTGSIQINGQQFEGTLEQFIEEQQIQTIIVGDGPKLSKLLVEQLLNLKFRGIEVYNFPTFYSFLAGKIPIQHTKESWLLFSLQEKRFQTKFYQNGKRIFDIFLASFLLFFLLPLFFLIGGIIKLSSKGPVFFRQERLGFNKKNLVLPQNLWVKKDQFRPMS